MSQPTLLDQIILPDSAKEQMCRLLLAEFGVTRIQHTPGTGELKCCCPMPWHNERHPSAALNYQKLVFNCFSCGSAGGLLWFISACREVPGSEARRWLDNQTGLGDETDLDTLLDLLDAIHSERSTIRPPMPTFSPMVLKPWRVIHPYVTEFRHVPEENVIALQVGYAERYQVSKDPETFSERIIIPHFWRGKLVGWQSRRIFDDGTPKYLSTVDLPRDSTIFNYDPTRKTAAWVESPWSALRHRHHLPIEATFGTEVTDAQVRQLAQHERVILCPDPDPPGWAAVTGRDEPNAQSWKPPTHVPGLAEKLLPYSDVYVWENPWSADMGDLTDEVAAELVEEAVPYAVWDPPDPDSLRKWEYPT